MTRNSRRRNAGLIGAGLLLGAAVAGCGRESPVAADDPGSYTTVSIDLSELHRPPALGMQVACASLAAEAALRVTPEHGAVQQYSRAIPAEASTIRFDSIAVTEGSVDFSVSITSDNGTLLYGGEATEQISAPTFQVDLALAKLAPVLQVCPGHIVLDRSTEFSGTVQIFNRGIGTLTYEAVAPTCAGVPCIGFEVPTGSAAPDQFSELFAFLPRMTNETSLEVRVHSPEGSVPLGVTLGQLPDLVVETLEATGDVLLVNRQTAQPVRVVIRNAGNAPAAIFKVAAEYTRSDTTFLGPFQVPGQTDFFYAFTQGQLEPGNAVTLEGFILFFAFGEGTPVAFRVHADSCSGDELQPDYCRVDEFDEGNNVSGDLATALP
jgi:hypothetical protein